MKGTIHIRPASAQDKDSIVRFCQDTFEWGDYIPDVWDEWLVDRNGKLLAAVVDAQAVGILHLALLTNGEAWLEGMRVHPDYRRLGVATELDAYARAYASERGWRIARLATSIRNLAAQATLVRMGYVRAMQFNDWLADSLDGEQGTVRVAAESDVRDLFQEWEHSARGGRGVLLPDEGWRWTELTVSRLRERVRAGQVRQVLDGFAVLPAFEHGEDSGLGVLALVGSDKAVRALAAAARCEAAYRGYARVEALIADHPLLNEVLEDAGYRVEGAMLIYEKEL